MIPSIYKKNRAIFLIPALLIIVGVIFNHFRLRDEVYLFIPSKIPTGFVIVEDAVDVIMSGDLGLGIKRNYRSGDRELRVTTYKAVINLQEYCKDFPSENYKNIEYETVSDKQVCSYQYITDDKARSYHYLLIDNILVEIVEINKPFMTQAQFLEFIESLEKSKNN